MPLYRRLPKRGFNNTQFQIEIKIVNLADLERVFEDGAQVTRELLVQKGVIKIPHSVKGAGNVLVKILGNGKLTKKLDVCADAFSKSAQKAIQDRGGQARLSKEM